MNAAKRRRRPLWRWIRHVRFKLDDPRYIGALLGCCWVMHAGYIPYEMMNGAPREYDRAPAEPPLRHPDRLASHQALSPVEEEQWAALARAFQRDPGAERRLRPRDADPGPPQR